MSCLFDSEQSSYRKYSQSMTWLIAIHLYTDFKGKEVNMFAFFYFFIVNHKNNVLLFYSSMT